MSVNSSNSTLPFLEVPAMLILVQTENEHGQVHIFQFIYSKSFEIHHRLAIIYHSEGKHCDIHLSLLFQSLFKHSYCACKLHQL